MEIRKSKRWAFRGMLSRVRCGCASPRGGLLDFIRQLASFEACFEIEKEALQVAAGQPEYPDSERDKWRERAAMLERNIDEGRDQGRRSSRWRGRRRRKAAQKFQLREVRRAQVSKILDRAVYVRIDGIDWLVSIPEVSWNEVRDVSRLVAVGQTVGVKVLSVPPQSKHPYLLLLTR